MEDPGEVDLFQFAKEEFHNGEQGGYRHEEMHRRFSPFPPWRSRRSRLTAPQSPGQVALTGPPFEVVP